MRVADVRSTPLAAVDMSDVDLLAWFGGDFDDATLDGAPRLRGAGGVTEAEGPPCMATLLSRGIPFVDATRAWGQSVAEVGMALTLSALRRLPYHMRRLQEGVPGAWEFELQQFADDPRFVNGDLGTKRVGVVGLGAIGGRIAAWSRAFGAAVRAHDPHVAPQRFAEVGAEPADLDAIVEWCDILHVAVPPTPSARHMIDRRRIERLRHGAIVVSVTRAAPIDVAALRERLLRDELVWAADVFDVEPLPAGDPLLGRDNVVALPHVAGRTRDACLRVADLIADDFLRIAAGQPPVCALTAEAVELRTGVRPAMRPPA